MKIYPKKYCDLYSWNRIAPYAQGIGVEGDSPKGLGDRFQALYRDAYREIWHFAICQAWLELKITYRGRRRADEDISLPIGHISAAFFRSYVQISPCFITSVRTWPIITSYFKTFYPDYEAHDPFIDREYYKFPYEHITLDFLAFVYQVENREELLEKAETDKMGYYDFVNWATNWVLSYNDDKGEEIYTVRKHNDNVKYIKNLRKPKKWRSI